MMRQLLTLPAIGMAMLAVPLSVSAGVTVFSDLTFNPADYSQVSYLDNGAVTITTGQTPTGGNPGAALQILADVPPNTVFASMQGFANNTFLYDPSTQGAVQTIDASIDKEFNTDLNLASNTFRPLVLQGGKYYVAAITLPATKNVWLTGSQNGLASSDFTLFDFGTGLFDATQHPNFSGGPMELGIANRLTQTSNASPNHDDIRYDNFRLQLNTVPEPAGLGMAGASAISILLCSGRRRVSATLHLD